jgi:hypothetical protein
MPLSLQSISRVNGSSCNHFSVTFNVDGATATRVLSRSQIDNLMENIDIGFPGNYKHLLIALLARYRLEQGVALNQLAAQTVIS